MELRSSISSQYFSNRQTCNGNLFGGGEPYYLIAELGWDDMAALQEAFQSPEGQATAQDVSTFATGESEV
ncbi:MAG: EthD family reductase [Ktedonobacteraceae bacterium]|nr:EthD family reductase [Ktedonobacteraceae bacterium]